MTICDKIISNEPTLEETMKSVAQQLEEIGLTKGLEQGLEQGMQKGLEKGAIQRTLEMAENMLKYGDPVNKVVAVTGLEKSTIVNLKKNLK